MRLARSSMIPKIDEYSSTVLGISVLELMNRSGAAIERAVRNRVREGAHVVILAGKGNNGGDAYAAATKLMGDYDVLIYDVFSNGQKSSEGRHFRELYISLGGVLKNFEHKKEYTDSIRNADCIIDGVFGTGFHGEMPEFVRPIAIAIRESVGAYKIAVDVPLGINADDGSVSDFAITVGATVELSYIKPGIVSYPARAYVGEIIYDDLGLPFDRISEEFNFKYNTVDAQWVRDNLPHREANSNKGTFGKLLLITGSERYRGAAYLTSEAALRGGAGLVSYLGCPALVSELMQKYPEIVYNETQSEDEGTVSLALSLSAKHSATLIGSGSSNSPLTARLTRELLSMEGAALILDADAINSLAEGVSDSASLIKESKRMVILTPHPLEFARLIGSDVKTVQANRLSLSKKFAKENSCIVVLKGAGTIVTDGTNTYINTSGSSALSKAGSGDVLAGLIASLVAMGKTEPIKAAALAVYYHGIAGDSLAEGLSSFGVMPSDLPLEIARQIARTESERE